MQLIHPLATSLNSIVAPPEFRFPSFASGSQKIGDFLGVALQVQQHEVLFASLKKTN